MRAGIVLIAVDRIRLTPRYLSAHDIPPGLAFKIGVCQCLAMIPGVSRSGSTIVGGLLLGAEKRAAAEFSFFLAMPTMAGAFAYDLYKNWSILDMQDAVQIGVGFVAAFIAAVIVVRYALAFISQHGLGTVRLVAHHRGRCGPCRAVGGGLSPSSCPKAGAIDAMSGSKKRRGD